jgi:hypothetical protein
MKKKKYIKEEKPMKWPGKSREELAELAKRLEEEERKRRDYIALIMTHFDESLKGLYKEIKKLGYEELNAVEVVDCKEALRRELNKLSLEGLKDVLKTRDNKGLEFIRDFIFERYYAEEGEESEEGEEE